MAFSMVSEGRAGLTPAAPTLSCLLRPLPPLVSSLFPQRNNSRGVSDILDSDSPALSTCSNADIFRTMNTMLGNALDLTGVCTTPTGPRARMDLLSGKTPSAMFD